MIFALGVWLTLSLLKWINLHSCQCEQHHSDSGDIGKTRGGHESGRGMLLGSERKKSLGNMVKIYCMLLWNCQGISKIF